MKRRASPSDPGENEADRIAAEWAARLDGLGDGEADHPALQRWLDADVRHRGAFIRSQAALHLLGSARERGGAAEGGGRQVYQPEPVMGRRAVMAGLAACAAGAVWSAVSWPQRVEAKTLSTGLGEVQRFRFKNGSSVMLDSNSRIELRTEADGDKIDLLSGGAWFDILEQDDRAVLVASNGLTVRATRCAFAVNLIPAPEVIVTRGALDLERSNRLVAGFRLAAGTRATVEPNGQTSIAVMSQAEIQRVLAWRQGGLSLDGETVAVAASRFNRYNRQQLIIRDDQIGSQPVVGWFDIRNPMQFAQAVALSFGGVVEAADGEIRIAKN